MTQAEQSGMNENLHWLRRAYDWAKQVLRLRRDVAELKNTVGKIDASIPPRPCDLRLVHGIYWGRYGDDQRVHPFCPACAAKAVYAPLTRDDRYANGERRRDGRLSYRCPSCQWTDMRIIDQEREGLGI